MEHAPINLFRHGWASLAISRICLRSHPRKALWFRDLCRHVSGGVIDRNRLRVVLEDDEEICARLEQELQRYLSVLNNQG